MKQQVKNDTFQEEDDQQSEEEQQAVTTIQGPVEPEVNPEPEDPIPPTYHETPDDDDDYDHDYDYVQLKDEYLELLKEVKSKPIKERKKLSMLKNDKKLKGVVKTLDKIIEETSTANIHLTTINQMQYTAALLITNKITPPKPTTNRKPRGGPPAWQQRLQKQIDQLRGDISIITEYTNGNTINKIMRKLKTILKKHEVTADEQLIACKEDLKQALQAKAQRIRYTKRSEQFKQNKMFSEDSKRFYRELGKKTIQIEKPPDIGEVKKFWQNILEQEVKHNEDAQCINDQEEELQQINQVEWRTSPFEELTANMTRAANWKSPGPDRLPNFWIKQFKSLHKPMTEVYSKIDKDQKQTPHWLVEGATNLLPKKEETWIPKNYRPATNLLPKKEETWIPKNYRPIACLPTTFKILTSVITDRLYNHLEKEAIMTPEQRGEKKDCYGCRDQLMINNAILENCKKRKKNLSTAWINYKKAFDSVPHSWILKCLQMYKIHPVLITFIEESMNQWKTNMTLVHKEGVLETGPIRIKRGIFQGDSLSPLLFTMSLNPLSKELQKMGYGYQLDEQTKINHLFYVDGARSCMEPVTNN